MVTRSPHVKELNSICQDLAASTLGLFAIVLPSLSCSVFLEPLSVSPIVHFTSPVSPPFQSTGCIQPIAQMVTYSTK